MGITDTPLGRVGGVPGPLARAGAIVHGANYDTASSAPCAEGTLECLGDAQLVKATAINGVLPDLNSAIDHAAFEVLRSLHPALNFDDEIAAARSTIPAVVTPAQREAGTEVGQMTAAATIATRQNDGSAPVAPYAGFTGPDTGVPPAPVTAPPAVGSGQALRHGVERAVPPRRPGWAHADEHAAAEPGVRRPGRRREEPRRRGIDHPDRRPDEGGAVPSRSTPRPGSRYSTARSPATPATTSRSSYRKAPVLRDGRAPPARS
ncbi:hypothetical protein GCM10010230_55050 [Streptomyces narbonensis]|nr:hypothetical protein GCM10010230_55050 [Streptomyces narbonensis]